VRRTSCAAQLLPITLGLCLGLGCNAQTTSQPWPLRFQRMDNDQMTVRYEMTSRADTLMITASVDYMSALKAGTPITARSFWHSPFSWSLPRLSVKTENSTDHEVLLEKVVVNVKTSEIDRTPIPIILNGLMRTIGFYNDGWGDLVGTELEVGILPEKYCSDDKVEVQKSALKQWKSVKIGRVADRYELEVSDLAKAGKIKGPNACGIGVLRYKDEQGTPWQVPFRTNVWLGGRRYGAPSPPNTSYDLFLSAGKYGYATELPVSQSVPAKGSDHFQVAVYSDKTASFELTANVLSSRGISVAFSTIKLAYFRPRSARPPRSEISQYKDVDQSTLAIDSLAPYVTNVRFDPIKPSSFVIGATEEWMLLPSVKRNDVHTKIADGLKKLGLAGGSYCYHLGSSECVDVGSFQWKN
jgi:hypothetical protein